MSEKELVALNDGGVVPEMGPSGAPAPFRSREARRLVCTRATVHLAATADARARAAHVSRRKGCAAYLGHGEHLHGKVGVY